MDFLVRTDFARPASMGDHEFDSLRALEVERAGVLQRSGTIRQLWREIGTTVAWGIWEAQDEESVRASIHSLPLAPWMSIDIHRIIDHPNALIREQPLRSQK